MTSQLLLGAIKWGDAISLLLVGCAMLLHRSATRAGELRPSRRAAPRHQRAPGRHQVAAPPEQVSAVWRGDCKVEPEMSRSIFQILGWKLISIGRQPVLIAATRCYLIQMLRSALTCTNGRSCWSPDEENNSRIFLTMDALYRLS
jgi:hypothetical protein